MESREGGQAINKVYEFWVKHKVKGRGVLRFKEPGMAREYVSSLLALGISWSQINLLWIGARFTQREAKSHREHWRKSLSLSRCIQIGAQSIYNERPLSKSKGYMDIRVVNESTQNDIIVSKSS